MKRALVILVLVGASVAFASSLGIPWFADVAAPGSGWPPVEGTGPATIIYLKNNTPDIIECEILYFNAAGMELGPYGEDATFEVQPNASLAFRPVQYDPNTEPGGQEDPASGLLVPDRPMGEDSPEPDGGRPNGSAVISWQGGPNDIQGMIATTGYGKGGMLSYAHLLPPGL